MMEESDPLPQTVEALRQRCRSLQADLFAEATACQVHANSRPTLVMLQDYHLLLKPVISTVIASPPIGRRNKKSALAALSTW
jgi:hypothetical protein